MCSRSFGEANLLATPSEFRKWLEKHHEKAKELWVDSIRRVPARSASRGRKRLTKPSALAGLTAFARELTLSAMPSGLRLANLTARGAPSTSNAPRRF